MTISDDLYCFLEYARTIPEVEARQVEPVTMSNDELDQMIINNLQPLRDSDEESYVTLSGSPTEGQALVDMIDRELQNCFDGTGHQNTLSRLAFMIFESIQLDHFSVSIDGDDFEFLKSLADSENLSFASLNDAEHRETFDITLGFDEARTIIKALKKNNQAQIAREVQNSSLSDSSMEASLTFDDWAIVLGCLRDTGNQKLFDKIQVKIGAMETTEPSFTFGQFERLAILRMVEWACEQYGGHRLSTATYLRHTFSQDEGPYVLNNIELFFIIYNLTKYAESECEPQSVDYLAICCLASQVQDVFDSAFSQND